MKLKLDDKGGVVVQDGKPVYVYDDGKEIAFDAPQAVEKIHALGKEAKSHRERAEGLETQLQGFAGIEAEAARAAIDKLASIDQRKLVDAGQVETLKAEINKGWQGKLDAEVQARTKAEQLLNNEILGGNFARSKFITDKLVIPSEVAQAFFGKHFTPKDGKLSVTDIHGNPLMSRIKPGEPPSFDEALELLVDQYPQGDSLRKASNGRGSGAPVNGGGSGNGKSMTRQAFDALPIDQRAAALKGGAVVVD